MYPWPAGSLCLPFPWQRRRPCRPLLPPDIPGVTAFPGPACWMRPETRLPVMPWTLWRWSRVSGWPGHPDTGYPAGRTFPPRSGGYHAGGHEVLYWSWLPRSSVPSGNNCFPVRAICRCCLPSPGHAPAGVRAWDRFLSGSLPDIR